MADTTRAAFSSGNAAPSIGQGRWTCHDRDALYLSTGAKSVEGGCAPLVVPQPVPRFARTASLPGMHKFVSRDVWSGGGT